MKKSFEETLKEEIKNLENNPYVIKGRQKTDGTYFLSNEKETKKWLPLF